MTTRRKKVVRRMALASQAKDAGDYESALQEYNVLSVMSNTMRTLSAQCEAVRPIEIVKPVGSGKIYLHTIYLVMIDFDDPGNYETTFRSLCGLLKQDLNKITAIELYCMALQFFMTRNMTEALGAILRKEGFDVTVCSLEQYFEAREINAATIAADMPDDIPMFSTSTAVAYCAVILLLMTKLLSAANYTQWLHNRLQAFAQKCIVVWELDDMKAYFPELANCITIHAGISSLHPIRKLVCETALTGYRTQGPFGSACGILRTLLAYGELSHIYQLQRVALMSDGIVLALPQIEADKKSAILAFRTLQNMGELGPYAQYLTKPEDYPMLRRSNFPILAELATRLAIKNGQLSLANYRGAGGAQSQTKFQVDSALLTLSLWSRYSNREALQHLRVLYDDTVVDSLMDDARKVRELESKIVEVEVSDSDDEQ